MLYIKQTDLMDDVLEGPSDADCELCNCLMQSEDLHYDSLFFLYECYAPYGVETYNGASFHD